MSPMLAQLGHNSSIEILTKCDIISSTYEKRGYKVRIRQRPRYVDPLKCVECGLCSKKCPVSKTLMSPFYDKKRAAIYLPSINAIPRGFVIDEKVCLYFQDGSCRICERICPKGAIHLDQNAKEMELDVQGIVFSPGTSAYKPDQLKHYGYGELKDVVTNMEFESLLNPLGVSHGMIRRPSDGEIPKRIAWIQCVGSRQTKGVYRPYCSSVCCSVAIKQAVTARQLLEPPPDTDIFYMDIRTHQKGAERYFRSAQAKGVNFICSRPYGVRLERNGKLAIDVFSHVNGHKRCLYDMIVLSTGLFVTKDTTELAWKLGLETDDFGFNLSPRPEPEGTTNRRIFVCGSFNGPKSIPGAVVEGSAAAALMRRSFGKGKLLVHKGKLDLPIKRPRPIPSEPKRVGLFVCRCGTNIGSVIDVERIVELFSSSNEVAFCRSLSFSCAPDGVRAIKDAILENRLNRIVIAACSPRSHEAIFKKAMEEAGADPSLLMIANIREQAAWVHQDDTEGAFSRAMEQIVMAIKKVGLLKPMAQKSYPVTRRALVLGGGISGMTAASIVADAGIEVSLVEKTGRLGGNGLSLLKTWRGMDVKSLVRRLEKRIKNHPGITVYLNSTVTGLQGVTGNYTTFVRARDSSMISIDHGALVIATGAREARPSGYLYGSHPRVLTHQDLDRLLLHPGSLDLGEARCVAFIQCVDSCNDKRPYCSRVCCTHAVTRAVYLKERFPDLEVCILYKHMRTYGLRDDYFRKAKKMGIKAIRFGQHQEPKLSALTALDEKGRPFRQLHLSVHDELLSQDVVLRPDFVILAAAIEPDQENNRELADLLKVPVGPDGFFQEAHLKLRPCELRRSGFFVAGLAHHPKEVEESMSQAEAAASKVISFLSKDRVVSENLTATVLTERCDGCALCLDVCKEQALSLCEFVRDGQVKQMAEIDESVCTGCGACTAVCPKDAVGIPGYMPCEIKVQIEALMSMEAVDERG